MFFNRITPIICRTTLIATCFSFSIFSNASIGLNEYQAKLTSLQSEKPSLESRLSKALEKQQAMNERLQKAKSVYDEMKKKLEVAEQKYASDASQSNGVVLENAKKRFSLSEISYKSRSSSANRVSARVIDLQEELKNTGLEISKLQTQISEEKNKLEEQRKEKEKLALLKAKKDAKVKKKVAVITSEIKRVKTVKAAPPKKDLGNIEFAVGGKKAPSAGKKMKNKSPGQEHLVRLTQLLEKPDNATPRYKSLILRGSGVKRKVKFEYLGHNQYRAEAVVNRGKVKFDTFHKVVKGVIPSEDHGETYVFLFDARTKNDLRLRYYKKSQLIASNES